VFWLEKVRFLGFFLLFPLIFCHSPQNFSPPSLFHCSMVFTGEVWLDHNHIGPSTFFCINFDFFFFVFLKASKVNVDSTRKISDCKIKAFKVERV
jgi:hypothetical protein